MPKVPVYKTRHITGGTVIHLTCTKHDTLPAVLLTVTVIHLTCKNAHFFLGGGFKMLLYTIMLTQQEIPTVNSLLVKNTQIIMSIVNIIVLFISKL